MSEEPAVSRPHPTPARRRGERGAALIVTSIVLLLVGMLALTSIKDSEQESTASARSRASSRTLYAADAGIQLALSRLVQNPPNLTAFDVDLADGANVQSRTRTETVAAPIAPVGTGSGKEGYGLGVGSGATSKSTVYEVNVTATYANAAAAELEARLSRTEAVATGY